MVLPTKIVTVNVFVKIATVLVGHFVEEAICDLLETVPQWTYAHQVIIVLIPVLLIVEVCIVLAVLLVVLVGVVLVLIGVVPVVLELVLRLPVEGDDDFRDDDVRDDDVRDDDVMDDDVTGAQVFCAVTLLSRRVTAPFKA